MFACAVLGVVSVSGLAWSWNRALRAGPIDRPSSRVMMTRALDTDRPGSPAVTPAVATPVTPRLDAVRRIDVNTATLAELDMLPGVGPAIGRRIIDDREANGPFASVDDLQRVSGIGPRTVEKIKPIAVAGVPADQADLASVDPGG